MTIRYSADGTRLEQTGWRDEWISKRHRTWGYDLPATDIDFILLEYGWEDKKPVALIEYKTIGSMRYLGAEKAIRDNRPISTLATMANLPAFIVAYDTKNVSFYVKSTNNAAEHINTYNWLMMSESSFIDFLHNLRINNE